MQSLLPPGAARALVTLCAGLGLAACETTTDNPVLLEDVPEKAGPSFGGDLPDLVEQQPLEQPMNSVDAFQLFGLDTDGDNVPDHEDQCPGFDDLLDVDGDTIPDGCDPCDDSVDNDSDGFATCAGDCDDADAAIHPDATETCDGVDDDCDGLVDQGVGDNFTLGDAAAYNVFVTGSMVGAVDIRGKAAAADLVLLAGFSIAEDNPGGDALVAGGDMDLTNGTVHGDAVYGDAASTTSVAFVGGSLVEGTPIDFAASGAVLTATSTGLAAQPANCVTTVLPWGGVVMVGSQAGRNVCAIDASDLNGAPSVSVQAPAGSTVFVNVAGASLNLSSAGLSLTGVTADRVLFNAHEATSVSLEAIGFVGSLLAPAAAVDFSNGSLDGQLLAAAFEGNGEPHHVPFTGDLHFGCGGPDPEVCDGLDNDGDGLIDEGFDADLDGVTTCAGDCDDLDSSVYPGAPELCDGLDNDCDALVPTDEIDDDGDLFAECDGDCDDSDALVNPDAAEVCDGIDNDCDGVLDPATCNGPTCGDGVVDLPVLPACPDPTVWTQVQNEAELLAWMANPVTSLDMRGDLDMGGADVIIETGCHIFTRDHGSLLGVGELSITALSIDIRSPLEASGDMTLLAEEFAIGHLCYMVEAGDLVIEAPSIDIRGDQHVTSVCFEADEITTSSRSQTDVSGGPVTMVAVDMDLHGDFENVSDMVIAATGQLDLRSNANYFADGDVSIAADVADLRSQLDFLGALTVDAAELTTRDTMSFAGGTSSTWTVSGYTEWHGDVLDGGNVVIESNTMDLRASAHIEAASDVLIDVVGELDARGKVRSNADVEITAGVYYLSSQHDFRFNSSCVLFGTPLANSKPINGCTASP